MPARESRRSWTVDVRRSIFKLEWPGVEKVDVEIGDVETLEAKYPDVADDLRAFSSESSGDRPCRAPKAQDSAAAWGDAPGSWCEWKATSAESAIHLRAQH